MDCWYYELAVAIIALLYGLYLWSTWHYNTFKKAGLPFRKPFPIFGNTAAFWLGQVALGYFSLDFYNSFKGKSVVGVFNFRFPGYVIRDPDIIKMITTKDFDHFVDRRDMGSNDDPLFGKSLFALKGTRWKSIRNILSPAFTSSKMKAMFFLVAESGRQLGDHLEEQCKASESGSLVVDMKDLFARYANDVIATSAFGLHCDSLKDPNNEFFLIGKEAMDFSGSRIFVVLFQFVAPQLAKLLDIPVTPHRVNNFFQNLVRDTMRNREREGIVRPDMIHLLMQAQKGTLKADDVTHQEKQDGGKAGITLTDGDITAQAFLFFAAGSDTSSTLHCFMSHLLAVHPDVQRRVQQEIDAVLHDDGGKLTYEGVVQRTKYLDMVISESLRLWPPVLQLERLCVKDYTIPATASQPAVEIKEGQEINIPVFAIHRDPEFYPNPERFDPERFSEENKNKLNHAAYLPFGAGPRGCIGLRFALMATKIMAVSLLSRFDLEVTGKTSIPLRLQKKTFNTTVEGGFWLAIKPRVKHTS